MAELVEGARLEIVFTGNRNKGSNPFLCAKQKSTPKGAFFVYAMKEEGIRRERRSAARQKSVRWTFF